MICSKSKFYGKYVELWKKVKDLIRSTCDNSNNHDEKNMKVRFN